MEMSQGTPRENGDRMESVTALLEQPVSLDTRPSRWRVGLIALATDHVSEQDFAAMRPGDDLAVHVSRVAFANPTTKETLLAMAPLLTEAAALILPGESLDAIAYACTAASALIGDRVIGQAIHAAKPEVPVITPTSAAIAALSTLGAGKVSVLAPYTQSVTDHLVSYFESGGLRVLNAGCLGLTDDREFARVSPGSIIEAALSVRHPDAEALFISCTALRAAVVASAIEERLEIPVVTSNQAMVWNTLRLAGCARAVPGHGQLLEIY